MLDPSHRQIHGASFRISLGGWQGAAEEHAPRGMAHARSHASNRSVWIPNGVSWRVGRAHDSGTATSGLQVHDVSVQDQVNKSLKLVGRVLGDKFRLTACIGIGGSGAVYKADQIALGRTVAVKILNEELSSDPRMIKRFRDEAMSASRLNHPNCVSIIDYGQSPDGLLYLAMEYVKGPTLTQLLVTQNPIGVDRVMQALAGIEEAHLAGVVHADLKADNIILDQRRAGIDVVKIVDFGIARLVTGVRDPDDRSISGTPEYMAPEVITGAPPSFASDLYAVGIILYELLAYKTPFFAGTTTEILSNHLKALIPQLSARREHVP